MNGIKMKDCRFYVDEAERVIVCVIPNTKFMVLNFIEDNFRFKDVDFDDAVAFSSFQQNLYMPNSFTGKAVCSKEDEWDEELGRKIAFSRAKDKCYKSFFKRANKFVQKIDMRLGDMITTFNDFGLKLENKRAALQEQIKEKVTLE